MKCATCGAFQCVLEKGKNFRGCPTEQEEILEQAIEELRKEENYEFYQTSAKIEKQGYGVWPRVKETMEFAKTMNYKKIGIAFCAGLKKEAEILHQIIEEHGMEAYSLMCKTGRMDKSQMGLSEEDKLHEGFEAMCNPVAQAYFLNEVATELNIILGLCVGHDALFSKYSNAFVTTLVVKDRVLAHNPVGALYTHHSYYRSKV